VDGWQQMWERSFRKKPVSLSGTPRTYIDLEYVAVGCDVAAKERFEQHRGS
jgi:hypothetical protein